MDYFETPIQKIKEHGIIGDKTKNLCQTGILAALQDPAGVKMYAKMALDAGATVEEEMEIIYLVLHAHSKNKGAAIGVELVDAIKRAGKW